MRAEELNPTDPRLISMFRGRGSRMSAGKQEVRDGYSPPSIQFSRQSGARKSTPKNKSGSGFGVGFQGAVRNAYNTQQAVVKIAKKGRTNSVADLKSQLQYISRQGEVALEGQGGDPVEFNEDGHAEDLLEDWTRDFDERGKRTSFNTYHLVVSYPEGTDSKVAELASKQFAERLTNGEYGDQWKYALAHHRDSANPHAHLVINRYGSAGKTLHLSRDAISIMQLRDLHVETSEMYGLTLNATSRFSRGVETRPVSQARYHAEREGRTLEPLPDRAEASAEPKFPFYGAVRRPTISLETLNAVRINVAQEYRALSAQFSEFATRADAESNDGVVERLKRLAASVETGNGVTDMNTTTTVDDVSVSGNETPKERPTMTDAQVDRFMSDLAQGRKDWFEANKGDGPNPHGKKLEQMVRTAAEESRRNPYMERQIKDDATVQREIKRQRDREQSRQNPDRLKRQQTAERGLQAAEKQQQHVRTGLRAIYDRTRENIDKLESDDRKTEVEKSLANILKNYDSFFTEDDRKYFGDAVIRDVKHNASLDDLDPANQRATAKREASGGDLTEDGERRDKLSDVQREAAERLDRADRTVVELFKERGMNGEVALQRIKDAPEVDRQTRSDWLDRDVKELSRQSNTGEKKARDELTTAYKDASRIYAKARDDIREITRSPEDKRAEESKDRAVLSRSEKRSDSRTRSISR